MGRKNKDNIMISFVAYMGNYPNQISVSQHFFWKYVYFIRKV